MATGLADTWGVILVVLFFETILYGMALLQTWLYFIWYSKDSWKLKSIVLILATTETFQTVLYFQSTYTVLIDHFGDFAELEVLSWEDTAQFFGGFFSAFVVQLYFASVIFKLTTNWRMRAVVGLIVTLSVLSLGAAIWLSVIVGEAGYFYNIGLPYDRKVSAVQTISTLACDVLITVCLCFTFGRKAHMQISSGTNNMLHILTINAVNRGVLTAICAVLNVGLFLGLPHQLYYFIGQVLAGKLYMNSLLATLNARQHIRHIVGNEEFFDSVPMSNRNPRLKPEISNIVFQEGTGTYLSSEATKTTTIRDVV